MEPWTILNFYHKTKHFITRGGRSYQMASLQFSVESLTARYPNPVLSRHLSDLKIYLDSWILSESQRSRHFHEERMFRFWTLALKSSYFSNSLWIQTVWLEYPTMIGSPTSLSYCASDLNGCGLTPFLTKRKANKTRKCIWREVPSSQTPYTPKT